MLFFYGMVEGIKGVSVLYCMLEHVLGLANKIVGSQPYLFSCLAITMPLVNKRCCKVSLHWAVSLTALFYVCVNILLN